MGDEGKEQTLLDKYNAMWGLAQKGMKNVLKAEESIRNKQFKRAVSILQGSLPDLRTAYLLSLHRRNKRLISSFRLLAALPKKLDSLKEMTATFQAILVDTKSKVEKTIHAKNDEDIKKRFEDIDIKEVKLEFAWGKKIVDLISSIPTLENSLGEALALQGEFEHAHKKELAKKINAYLATQDSPIKIQGREFVVLCPDVELRKVAFNQCTFTGVGINYGSSKGGWIHFTGCTFSQSIFERAGEESYLSLKNSRLSNVSGIINADFESVTFSNCKKLDVYARDGGNASVLAFRSSKLGLVNLAGLSMGGIRFESCSVGEVKFDPVEPRAGRELAIDMPISNLTFIGCNIGEMNASAKLREVKFQGFTFTNSTIKSGAFEVYSMTGMRITRGKFGRGFSYKCDRTNHSIFREISMEDNFSPKRFFSSTFIGVDFGRTKFGADDIFDHCHFEACKFERTLMVSNKLVFHNCEGLSKIKGLPETPIDIIYTAINRTDWGKGEKVNKEIYAALGGLKSSVNEVIRQWEADWGYSERTMHDFVDKLDQHIAVGILFPELQKFGVSFQKLRELETYSELLKYYQRKMATAESAAA